MQHRVVTRVASSTDNVLSNRVDIALITDDDVSVSWYRQCPPRLSLQTWLKIGIGVLLIAGLITVAVVFRKQLEDVSPSDPSSFCPRNVSSYPIYLPAMNFHHTTVISDP